MSANNHQSASSPLLISGLSDTDIDKLLPWERVIWVSEPFALMSGTGAAFTLTDKIKVIIDDINFKNFIYYLPLLFIFITYLNMRAFTSYNFYHMMQKRSFQ